MLYTELYWPKYSVLYVKEKIPGLCRGSTCNFIQVTALLHFHSYDYVSPKQSANVSNN